MAAFSAMLLARIPVQFGLVAERECEPRRTPPLECEQSSKVRDPRTRTSFTPVSNKLVRANARRASLRALFTGSKPGRAESERCPPRRALMAVPAAGNTRRST